MADQWNLELMVNAVGPDDTHVRVRRLSPGVWNPHLVVRTGPVQIYCLDASSVTDTAAAWASAKVRASHLLPVEAPPPPHDPKRTSLGVTSPVAEIVMDGRQAWNVAPPFGGRRQLVVSVGSIGFRVHDLVALDAQIHIWAQASAFAPRVYGKASPPFNRLVEQAQIQATRTAARNAERRAERGLP
jgi:hypothetical protein